MPAKTEDAQHCLVRIEDSKNPGGSVQVTPYDRLHGFLNFRRKSLTLVWCYRDMLDEAALRDSLTKTLHAYPGLVGRRAGSSHIDLSNAGVPFLTRMAEPPTLSLDELLEYLAPPSYRGAADPLGLRGRFVLPLTHFGDGDAVPFLAVLLTRFASGGSVLGVAVDHGFCDMDAAMGFVQNWACVYRGEDMMPVPEHDRCMFLRMPPLMADSDVHVQPSGFFCTLPGQKEGKSIKSFGASRVQGDPAWVLVAGLSKEALAFLKVEANRELPEGLFVSTDDALTAHVWRAMCIMRCTQLGIDSASELPSTLARACNFRARMMPPLPVGYCGNAVSELYTRFSVAELQSLPLSQVALQLRKDLDAATPEYFSRQAHWLEERYQEGCKVGYEYPKDPNFLSFHITSWRYDFGRANFGSRPVWFDQANAAYISAFLIADMDGGVMVGVQGPRDSMEQMASLLAC